MSATPPPVAPATGGASGGARAFAALLVAGTALRLALTWSGACDNRVIADDAFYYFTIARHVAAGHGVTFDGLAPTNGFHPLWLVLLTPVFALAQALRLGPWSAVHLALSLCAALDALSGALLWRLVRRLAGPRAAVAAALVWFLSPFTALLTLRGLESALNVALFATWLTVLADGFERAARDRSRDADVSPGAREGMAIGAVMGLAFLARTDNGPLLAVALGAATALEALRARALRRPLAFLAAAAGAMTLFALPWFVWNVLAFGTPWQVSGAAKLANPTLFGRVPHALPHELRYLLAPVWVPAFFVAGESMKFKAAFQVVATTLWTVLALLLPFLAWALVRPRAAVQRPVAVALLVFLLAHAAVYVLVLHSYVVWYATVPLFVLVLLFGGLAAGRLLDHLPTAARATLGVVAVLACAAGFAQYVRATRFVPRGEEAVVRPILTRIATEAPGTRTVGVFNAGAAGYFAPGIGPFTIVNLDGLVNNAAVEAWRQGRYFEYLDATVDVVIDDGGPALGYMLGPEGRERFAARYPIWSPKSLVHGPRLREPVRPAAPGTSAAP